MPSTESYLLIIIMGSGLAQPSTSTSYNLEIKLT